MMNNRMAIWTISVAVLGFLAACVLDSMDLTWLDERQVSVIVAYIGLIFVPLSVTFSCLLRSHLKDIDSRITRVGETVESLRAQVRLDLAELAGHIDRPYLCWLRNELLGAVRQPLQMLVLNTITDVAKCTTRLADCIKNLQDTDEILAVCGDKKWDAKEVNEYYDANYKKRVKRVFLIEPGRIFDAAKKKILVDHLSPKRSNVEARIVPSHRYTEIVSKYCIPPGFGFAILGTTVIVHWGLENQNPPAGVELTHPEFVRIHTEVHDYLWSCGIGDKSKPGELLTIWEKILEPDEGTREEKEAWWRILFPGKNLPASLT